MADEGTFGVHAQTENRAVKLDSLALNQGDEKRNNGTTSGTSVNNSEDEELQVYKLARALTEQSIRNSDGEYVNPFLGSDNPALDPRSGNFSAKAWSKTLLAIQSRDPERYPARTAGVAYKNLSAHGFGEATDYQKTFGNTPLELGNIFRKMIGLGKKSKIQILRDFDGLVRSGEMLVVLGRPGR